MKIILVALIIAATLTPEVLGHGAMVSPRPRSSHNQVLDSANKCGCANRPGGCYSNATRPGAYCGLGCIGNACLYYQIECFQGCGTCSLEGKTLYPVPADLKNAGCQTPPAPTLGGGDAAAEHALRTYNIDQASAFGDWTKWNPWRSPGTAGKGNPKFQPCGINSGSDVSFPDPPAHGQAKAAPGSDLPPLPKSSQTTWKSGSVVEAEWSIYANHGGGYSYRLCKKVEGKTATEECYQQTPLDFATDTTEIKYYDGSRKPFLINATTTNKGTWPVGSQWRKNPIPMCNCDIGAHCGAKGGNQFAKGKLADHMRMMVEAATPVEPLDEVEVDAGKQCHETPKSKCATSGFTNTCLKCGKTGGFDCQECCPGLKKTTKTIGGKTYTWCAASKSNTCSKDNPRACYFNAYPKSHLRPGQQTSRCPTGVQFPTSFDEGYGIGAALNDLPNGFEFTMVDKLQVPKLAAGEYSLSWRWDCEETPQVWNSCADVTVTA